MKKIFLLLSTVLLSHFSQGQNSTFDTQAIAMLKTFCTDYMTSIATSHPNNFSAHEKNEVNLKKKYCTGDLLKKLPKLAEQSYSDPLINAQDSREDCVKNLSFKRNLQKPNAYTVSYFYVDEFTKKKEVTNINLTVVNENGGFKISSVW